SASSTGPRLSLAARTTQVHSRREAFGHGLAAVPSACAAEVPPQSRLIDVVVRPRSSVQGGQPIGHRLLSVLGPAYRAGQDTEEAGQDVEGEAGGEEGQACGQTFGDPAEQSLNDRLSYFEVLLSRTHAS